MTKHRIGFALRAGVFSASEMSQTVTVLDKAHRAISVFVPEGRTGLESLQTLGSLLGITKHVHAGSGVIRLLEHDPTILARRVQTLQSFSNNRFFLGVGTGAPSAYPGKVVLKLVDKLEQLRQIFETFPKGIEAPGIYVAALKSGIAKMAVMKGHSLLLNFCSPQHAMKIVHSVKPLLGENVDVACYLKLFYASQNDIVAQRLLVQEFLNYDTAPQYHSMFLQDGTAEAIGKFRQSDDWIKGSFAVPETMLRVSLANPTEEQLRDYVTTFRDVGITLPVFYPYFPEGESSQYKLDTIKRMMIFL